MLYKKIIKPFFFRWNPEDAHYKAMSLWTMATRIPGVKAYYAAKSKNNEQPVTVAGITFPNRVGLAAGFDKNGKWIDELALLGFGHIEVGTITPKSQPGNDKPRLFRLPQDEALINRMGFNNDGVETLVKQLKSRKSDVVVGGNIGKNKWTENEDAFKDYLICFEALHDCVDYFVVNVSSPNTPNLRALQEKGPLLQILTSLQNHELQKKNAKPIFLKIAPDLTNESLMDVIDVVSQSNVAGIIACNTTIDRSTLSTSKEEVEKIGAGGLSGKPAQKRALEVISIIRKSNPNLAIIGVGGIFTGRDAQMAIEAGADLVQVYTGFIYEGPSIAFSISKELQSLKIS
jgi:dihydroorotate dehydrogenase